MKDLETNGLQQEFANVFVKEHMYVFFFSHTYDSVLAAFLLQQTDGISQIFFNQDPCV